METLTKPTDTRLRRFTETGTVYPILFMISITHLLNDMMQSVIPAVYPLLKEKFGFTFAQIGIITLVFQMTSSLLQPFIGLYADRHPRPTRSPRGCASRCSGCSPSPSPRASYPSCWR